MVMALYHHVQGHRAGQEDPWSESLEWMLNSSLGDGGSIMKLATPHSPPSGASAPSLYGHLNIITGAIIVFCFNRSIAEIKLFYISLNVLGIDSYLCHKYVEISERLKQQ